MPSFGDQPPGPRQAAWRQELVSVLANAFSNCDTGLSQRRTTDVRDLGAFLRVGCAPRTAGWLLCWRFDRWALGRAVVARSGRGRGSFDVEELLAAPFRVVGFATAAQAEEPFGHQQIHHGGHVDRERHCPGERDALYQIVNLQWQENGSRYHSEVFAPS